MTRQRKLLLKRELFLMFLPIALLLAGVIVVTADVRHPEVTTYQCEVLASGLNASKYRTGQNLLYTSSGQKIHDVALRCPTANLAASSNTNKAVSQKSGDGIVIINDFDVFVADIAPKDAAEVIRKRYRILPDRWLVNIHHVPKK